MRPARSGIPFAPPFDIAVSVASQAEVARIWAESSQVAMKAGNLNCAAEKEWKMKKHYHKAHRSGAFFLRLAAPNRGVRFGQPEHGVIV